VSTAEHFVDKNGKLRARGTKQLKGTQAYPTGFGAVHGLRFSEFFAAAGHDRCTLGPSLSQAKSPKRAKVDDVGCFADLDIAPIGYLGAPREFETKVVFIRLRLPADPTFVAYQWSGQVFKRKQINSAKSSEVLLWGFTKTQLSHCTICAARLQPHTPLPRGLRKATHNHSLKLPERQGF